MPRSRCETVRSPHRPGRSPEESPSPPTRSHFQRNWFGFPLLFLLMSLPVSAEESALNKAVTAYQDRQLEEAFRHARQAVHQEPQNPDVYVLLGELHYLRQELPEARQAWEKALRLDPDREDVRRGLERLGREEPIEDNLSRGDVHPFKVRYASGEIPVELGSLQQILRDVYRQVGQAFEHFPDHPIPVLLYPEAEFEAVKGLSHQVAGLYDGKIRLPVEPNRMTARHLERILWHEYSHALIHDLAKGKCPLWLNEGIATLQEDRVKPVDVGLARKALREGTMPTLENLWEGSYSQTQHLPLYYQTSFLLAQYLVKRWNWRELVRLLERLGEGVPFPEALQAQYRTDSDVLEQEWKAWMRRTL